MGEYLRILHTGDLHLGASLGRFSLLEEQEKMTAGLLSLAEQQQIDAVVLSGDIFDQAAPSAEAMDLYDRFLTALCRKCPVYMIAGNHDDAAQLASLAKLLRSSRLYVQGQLYERPQPVRQDNVEFWQIPYCQKEQVRCLYPGEKICSTNDAMRALMADVRTRRDPHAVCIVAAHCLVSGAVPCGSDTTALLETADPIDLSVFDGLDYVALGHLHQAQQPAKNIRYAGAPYPYSFSEREKSVSIFDTERAEITAVPINFGRELRVLRSTYEDLWKQPQSEAYLQIELTDHSAGLETLNALCSRYPRLITLRGQHGDTVSPGMLPSGPSELLNRFCEEIGDKPAEQEHATLLLALLQEIQEGGSVW